MKISVLTFSTESNQLKRPLSLTVIANWFARTDPILSSNYDGSMMQALPVACLLLIMSSGGSFAAISSALDLQTENLCFRNSDSSKRS